jgi:hypothetical protein
LQAERARIVPAQLLNEAGIVGAAMAAVDLIPVRPRARRTAAVKPPVRKKERTRK